MLLAGFYIGCSNRSEENESDHPIALQNLLDSNFHKKSFDSLMAIICKDTSGIEFSGGLLLSSNFRLIYEHSAAYLPDVAGFLLKGQFNDKQASVCIFSMQNLSVVDYVSLCRLYLRLYKDSLIKEGMLEEALLPDFQDVHIIGENYKDSNVITLLQDIKSQGISSEFKHAIDIVQDGSYIKGAQSSH
jgi:hypothetical protein